jgi:peptide deformylase
MTFNGILQYPDDILLEKCVDVDKIDSDVIEIANKLLFFVKKYNGLGLAAPQIGSNKRIIVINIQFFDPFKENIILINPKIISHSSNQIADLEGCLSLNNSLVSVRRYDKIVVEGLNLFGEQKIIKASGLLARIIQHEIDHLDGVLINQK